jgi:hypothetical protein
MIRALEMSKGMVYIAAKSLGCSANTVYHYIKRFPTVALAKEFQEGHVLDQAETKLYDAILAAEPWALKFVLMTKGKRRGYTTSSELNINLDLDQLTDEQLKIIAEGGDILSVFASRGASSTEIERETKATDGDDSSIALPGISEQI